MPTITEQIENILDRRLGRGLYEGKGRLQQIESRIELLRLVKERVNQLNALVLSIQKEIDLKRGSYYNLLGADPEALDKFNNVSCRKANEKIDIVIEELEKLKLRFSRESVRIAFIGRERQGKSTFIKTITGLTDKVIPAYSGNSCTGAVSVIQNTQEPLSVIVNYYTVTEFLNVVKEKLDRFFPGNSYYLGRLEDITELNLPDCLQNVSTTLSTEYDKFKRTVIDHYDDYKFLFSGPRQRTFTDENEIALHVAQYEEFPEPTPNTIEEYKNDGRIVYRRDYYRYIAVKSVDIYKKFNIDNAKKIEFVDTIGIGSAADSELIEKEMFRVLREDCDAAINLFRPDQTPNYPIEQSELLDKISERLSDREPSKWIVYVLNKATSGQFKNEASTNSLLGEVRRIIENKTNKPVAWVKAIDGNNLNDVSSELATPLLELLTNNLDYLDDNLMAHTQELATAAYNECLSLVTNANAVTTAGIGKSQNMLTIFDEKYDSLLSNLGRTLNQIDDCGYAKNRDEQCPQLEQEYLKILNNIDRSIPKQNAIQEKFETGALLTENNVFEEYVEQLRNDIFTQFEAVNTSVMLPLQEKVKKDLIDILYNNALMNRLSVESSIDEPVKWLNEIMDRYIDEANYPYLHKALRFIIDYQINIEGFVEYKVTEALHVIDRSHNEFIKYNGGYAHDYAQKASNVWQELCNRLMPIHNRMKSWFSEYNKIPSHSFYSRVHKFHIKLMTDEGGKRDLRKFYLNNMSLIWFDDIKLAAEAEKSFGDWTERVKGVQSVVISESFKIN